jgi:hypothetical protein
MSENMFPTEQEEHTLTGQPEDVFAPIKEKYGNDINKLAEAFKHMQSRSDQIENKLKIPETYAIKDEHKKVIKDTNLESLIKTAKAGEYTQKQFDALLDSVYEFQKDQQQKNLSLKEQREALLKEHETGIKDFYTNKLPDTLLSSILKEGNPEQLKILNEFRLQTLSKTTTPTPGGNMTEPVLDKEHLVKQKRNELIQISTKLRRATIDEQQELISTRNKLANEIVELSK